MIIAACLPAIWPLISKFISGGLLSSFASKQTPLQQYDNPAGIAKAGPQLAHVGDSSERIVDESQFERVESDRYAESVSLNEVPRHRES